MLTTGVTNATLAVLVLSAAGVLIVRVRVPEVVALIVQVRTPLAFVFTEEPQVVVAPVAFVVMEAEVAAPEMAILLASRRVIVQVEFVTPFAFTLLDAEHEKVE